MSDPDAPPHGCVLWHAVPRYDKVDVSDPKQCGRLPIKVEEQSWYYAVQRASALLGLAPEHVEVRRA